jgi:ABC-2 type transport system ATP-binding protein
VTASAAAEVVVTLADVVKRFGARVAVEGLNCRLEPGITCLVGPNGAGKTTTLELVAGLLRASSGEVRVTAAGTPVDGERRRALVGLVRQESGSYLLLTPLEHLQLAARLGRMSRRERAERIADLVDLLGIGRYAGVRMGRLSVGERRRVHLAMALVRRPRLVLLDEVTSGVDVTTRQTTLDLVSDLAGGGATICYSTHYLAEVDQLRGRVVVLDRGKCVIAGSYDSVVAHHAASTIRLTFDGPVQLPATWEVSWVDAVSASVRVTRSDGRTVARLLQELGADASRIVAVEVLSATLESAFLSLIDGEPGESRR